MTRRENLHYRSREHLTLDEVNQLIRAASARGRHQHRDSTLILLMFRHGLRASEAASLRWDGVVWSEAAISIRRAKKGRSGTHPLQPDEIEALQELKRLYPNSNYIFTGETGKPLSVDSVERIVENAGLLAKLGTKVHPHMLRHACGYHLINQGVDILKIQDYLGHVNLSNTAVYTRLKNNNFTDFQW